MSRRSRSDFDAHAGLSAARHTAPRKVHTPRASLPVSRVLGWMAWAVVAAVAYSFAAPVVRTFLGV